MKRTKMHQDNINGYNNPMRKKLINIIFTSTYAEMSVC